MTKKLLLLCTLAIILLLLVTTNSGSLETIKKLLSKEDLGQNKANKAHSMYKGPTKILSLEITSTGFWGAEAEVTYQANSRSINSSLFAEATLAGNRTIKTACKGIPTQLSVTFDEESKSTKIWIPRPSLSKQEIVTTEIIISTAEQCYYPIESAQYNLDSKETRVIHSLKTPINWPKFSSRPSTEFIPELPQQLPNIHLSINIEGIQNIATMIVARGYPAARLKFFQAPSQKTLGISLLNHYEIPTKLLGPILKELSNQGHTISITSEETNLIIDKPTIRIGGYSGKSSPIKRSSIEEITSPKTSNQKFYTVIGLPWESPEEQAITLVSSAKTLIDLNTKQATNKAKTKLDRAIKLHPNMPDLYIEMARYHMQTNPDFSEHTPSSTGIYVVGLLNNSLADNPGHANTLILLGYAQTTQDQFIAAEKSLLAAEQINTDNWWLWNNLGYLYKKQGKLEKSIEMYARTADQNHFIDLNRNAFIDSLNKISKLHISLNNIKAADLYFEKHHKLLPFTNTCMYRSHARMLTRHTEEFDRAIALAEISSNKECNAEIELATALYSKWHSIAKKTKIKSSNLHIRAKASSADQSKVFYVLSKYKAGQDILHALIKEGEDINIYWRNQTALIHAISKQNLTALKFLLSQGADPNYQPNHSYPTPIGLAVISNNSDIVKTLLTHGGNPEKINGNVPSARTIAVEIGNLEILKVLTDHEI